MVMGWSQTIPLISCQEIAVAPSMLVGTWLMAVLLWQQIKYYDYYCCHKELLLYQLSQTVCLSQELPQNHNCLLSNVLAIVNTGSDPEQAACPLYSLIMSLCWEHFSPHAMLTTQELRHKTAFQHSNSCVWVGSVKLYHLHIKEGYIFQAFPTTFRSLTTHSSYQSPYQTSCN